MNRSIKVLITIMVIVIGLLAGLTGYFYAKNVSLEKAAKSAADTQAIDNSAAANITTNVSASPSADASVSASPSTSTSPSVSIKATATKSASPSPSASSTSTASGTKYTVKAGDTISTIAAQYKINWLTLAKANGLDESTANSIKIGQVLTIPSN